MAVQDFKHISFDNEPIYSNTKLLCGEKEPMISIIKLEKNTPTDVRRYSSANEAAIALLKDGLKDEAYQLVTKHLTENDNPNPVVHLTEEKELLEQYYAKLD